MSSQRDPLRLFFRDNEATLWLSLICIVAVYLRFRGLTFQSYWFDELFSAYFSDPAHSFGEVVQLTASDVHPPLYQLAMWWSYKLFGYNEWAGRLPSAIAGVATIPVIYLLGRDIFNSRTGLYAAALALPNYYLLYYAQEARSYAFLYFFCSLSFLFFLRALTSSSRSNVVFYVLSTLAVLYTHYFGLALLATQGLIAAAYIVVTGWPNRPLIVRAAVAAGVIFVALLPLAPLIARHSAIDDFWIPAPEPGFLLNYIRAYFGSGAIAGVIMALACVAFIYPLRDAKLVQARFGVFALVAWIAMGYLLPWLRGLTGQPVLTDRNTIMLVPPLLVLAAYGLTSLPKLWIQRIVGSTLLAYSFYFLFFSLEYFERVTKNQYREIAQAMDAFEPKLPIYALIYNDNKYNVYFTQQDSSLVAKDVGELTIRLANDTVPPIFWLAGGHLTSPRTDPGKSYGMIEVGRYRYRGTAAALLVNPAVARRLKLNLSAAVPDDNRPVYMSELLPAGDGGVQLLVTVDQQNRAEFDEPILVELLTEGGQVVRSETVSPGPVPALLSLEPKQGAIYARIMLPAGEVLPEAWLVPEDIETQ